MFYNPKKQRGYLYYKIQSKKPKKPVAVINSIESECDTEQVESLKLFLKNVVVLNDEAVLKSKLLETVDRRLRLVEVDLENYMQHCSFYVAKPRLVRIVLFSMLVTHNFITNFVLPDSVRFGNLFQSH